MGRKKRVESESKTYHVVSCGMGHQIIFEDDNDRWRYVEQMKRFSKEEGVEFLAWCLMSNHVHMILKGELQSVSRFIMRLESSYVLVFNKKHVREGALFRPGFWSDPIDTDERLLTTVRYVHQNPVKARIVNTCAEYRWSSYSEYTRRPVFSDVDFVSVLLGSKKAFESFHQTLDESRGFLDIDTVRRRLSYEEALVLAHEAIGEASISSIVALPKEDRDEALSLLKSLGISNRQIAMMTGLGKSTIDRA